MVRVVCCFLFLCLAPFGSWGQVEDMPRQLDRLELVKNMDQLRGSYGFNKMIATEHELAMLVALSAFPELDSAKIEFKSAKIKTTLNARPSIGSLIFNSRKKRKYVIRINDSEKEGVVRIEGVSFNAKIGLFGHELCHFADYSERNIFGVLGRLMAYGSAKGKEKFEKEMDDKTIQRGLGWQLYDWSYYVLNDAKASKEYLEYKKRIYLEPEEIKRRIKSLD